MTTLQLLGVTTSFPLRDGSSAGIFVKRLYDALPETWRVDVACPADDAMPISGSQVNGRTRVLPVRYALRRWQVLAQQSGGIASGLRAAPWRIVLVPLLLFSLWWRCLRAGRKIDVIHANWAICGVIAGAAAILVRCPVVTTLRGDDATRATRSLLDRWVLNGAVRASTAIICVSEAMADQLRELYPRRARDIHVCLNGVDSDFSKIVRSPAKPGLLRVAAVGSLIPRKGYDVLIDAVARMRHQSAVRVQIAGAGPELGALLERVSRLGIQDNISFEGELSPAQIPQFLTHADVFVLASRAEGRPNVVVEALAAGLPVISTDLPGVIGLVDSDANGWLVPIGDATALAAVLDEASTDLDKCERFAAAARSGIASVSHDWVTTGASYDLLFRNALADFMKSRPR